MKNLNSEKPFKNPIKLLRSPFSVMLQTRPFFLEEHSKGTWTLKRHSRVTQRALKHSKKLEGHSKGTWAPKALGNPSS